MKVALCLFFATTLAGCMPWPTTIQPDVHLRVVDETGTPIAGATILFANYKIALHPEVSFVELTSDSAGEIHLPRESVTQIIVMAPDGGYSYDWSYCIAKPGYAPIVRNALSEMDFGEDEVVEVLTEAQMMGQCTWQDFPHGFIFDSET